MKHSYVRVVLSSVVPLVLLSLLASTSLANPGPIVFWFDDMEGDVSEWLSVDLTAGAAPHFHWDGYMAYDGDSWWCGNFEYDADGGYGNGWDDRLELPPVWANPVAVEDVSWGAVKSLYRDERSGGSAEQTRDAVVPVLTFAFRHDSEIGYDYTYVQAESSGAYVNLNRGYDGRQAWTDIGPYGFDLSTYDDPLSVRFRFMSDGAYSDEDGLYVSAGGGFAVDNIKIYDFVTGDILFYDSEPGGREDECIPAVPGAAGDYWHLIDRQCPALSDPHSWWCGDDADTSMVPPNLRNALISPAVDIAGTYACTVHFAMHFAIPTVDNDYITFRSTANGSDYYTIASMWGDFESCDGWGGTAYNIGYDILQFHAPPYTDGRFMWVMNTTDNGCGPAGGGDAGVMLDDVLFTSGGNYGSPGNDASQPASLLKLLPMERYDRRW